MTKRPAQQSIHRAVDILEALEEASDGMGVTALSNQLGLKVGTTHNILKALKLRGFVTQPPGSSYYTLGPRLIALASNGALQQSRLLRVAKQPLKRLHLSTRETVFLGVRQHTRSINLVLWESTHPITIRQNPRSPGTGLHCTAMGKVLISDLEDDELEALFAETGMPVCTDATISDLEVLEQELSAVRRNGYALNRGEEREGIYGVAAPVFNDHDRVFAGVCVGYPVRYREGLDEGDLVEQVKACAAQITDLLRGA
jgi:DNA-binding IclR family transcriptional regulator